MPQRTAMLVCGADTGKLAPQSYRLEYARLLEAVQDNARSREPMVLQRDLVAARVYLTQPETPGRKWVRFVDYLRSLGYTICLGQSTDIQLKVTHDLFMYALCGRVDAVVLVWGDSKGPTSAFVEGLRRARAHGVELSIWGTHMVPEGLKQVGQFRDLQEAGLVQVTKGVRG